MLMDIVSDQNASNQGEMPVDSTAPSEICDKTSRMRMARATFVNQMSNGRAITAHDLFHSQ